MQSERCQTDAHFRSKATRRVYMRLHHKLPDNFLKAPTGGILDHDHAAYCSAQDPRSLPSPLMIRGLGSFHSMAALPAHARRTKEFVQQRYHAEKARVHAEQIYDPESKRTNSSGDREALGGGGRCLLVATGQNESAPEPKPLPKFNRPVPQAATFVGLTSRTLLELAIGIDRGFMASGISRRRSTCRSPFSRLAPLTLT